VSSSRGAALLARFTLLLEHLGNAEVEPHRVAVAVTSTLLGLRSWWITKHRRRATAKVDNRASQSIIDTNA
jgi:hypothetical protein